MTGAPATAANRGTVLNLVWASRVDDDTAHVDARAVLEALGVIDSGGHELLPDDDRPHVVPGLGHSSGNADDPNTDSPKRAAASTARDRTGVPAGLRDLPPAAPPTKKARPMPAIAPPDVRVGEATQPPTSTYVAVLAVGELFVDHSYQRPVDDVRTRRMAEEWNPRMLGILDVSDRGAGWFNHGLPARYAVVDGQQRWTAGRRVAVQHVACNIHEGLTVADEARLMYELDRAKKKLSGWDQWRARRTAGDQTVATIERIAAAHGLRVDDAGELRSYGTAEKLLRVGGEQLLDTALAVLRAAYGDSPLAFQAPLLMGVGQLLHRHPTLDVPRLTKALAATRPEQLRSTATALREVDGGSLHELMARAVIGCYNRLPGARLAA